MHINTDIFLDILHSEMLSYAIALAKKNGAKEIFVGEPRIKGKNRERWLVPDVLGIRDSIDKPYIIVECEKFHGNIFRDGGKIANWSKDQKIRDKTDFHFILHGSAWYSRNKIDEFFKKGYYYYNFEELKKKLIPVKF